MQRGSDILARPGPALQEAQESIDLARTFVRTILKSLPPSITSFDDHSKDLMESGA
jgi:hypothetical protein